MFKKREKTNHIHVAFGYRDKLSSSTMTLVQEFPIAALTSEPGLPFTCQELVNLIEYDRHTKLKAR